VTVATELKRLLAVLILAVAGILSLPFAASFLDGQGGENWILPAQLVIMAALGVGVIWALPLPGHTAKPVSRSLFGALWGIGMAVVGLAVFWILLNGIGGA
jgi:hypothetical protein